MLRANIFKRKALLAAPLLAILGGYTWLVVAAVTPQLPSILSPVCFYSNQCRQDLKQIFYKALDTATRSISCHMYALTDPDLIALLEKKASTGISTHVFFDPSATSGLHKKIQSATTLKPVHCGGLMHRKIVVIDEALVLLGTANLTPQSLGQHDNFVVGFHHLGLAQFLKQEAPASSHYSFNIGEQKADPQKADLWLLPDVDHQALTCLKKLIESATKTIHVAQFTLTHPTLIEALVQAKQRGVRVSIACDFYTGRGASLKALELLKKAHIPIYLSRGQQLMHHKWACIDHETLIVGSANWTRAAFLRNQDCFVILHQLKPEQKKFVKRMWKVIKQESEVNI